LIAIVTVLIIFAALVIFIQAQRLHKLSKKYNLLEKAVNRAGAGITISDPNQADNPLIYVSDGFYHMTGYQTSEVLARNCRFLQGTETDQETVTKIRQAISSGQSVQVELLNYRKDGTPFWNELSINPIYEHNRLRYFVGIQKDVTIRRKLQLELEKDLLIAKNIQKSLLSATIDNESVRIEGYLQPSSQLAGDMYMWYQLDHNRYALLLIDVMGHGVASAMIANSIHILARRYMLKDTPPAKIIQLLNEFMFTLFNNQSDQLYFFTAIYLVIDTENNLIDYVNAGHLPILHQTATGQILHLDSNSTPVGILPNGTFSAGKIDFNKGDRLLLFTDGFIEESKQEYQDILKSVKTSLSEYSGSPPIFNYLLNKHADILNHDDDITLVNIERK
jgi:sigma-B regulation protein RsbU (phosphoserine phosphatase)